jgi:hypothetical protein
MRPHAAESAPENKAIFHDNHGLFLFTADYTDEHGLICRSVLARI